MNFNLQDWIKGNKGNDPLIVFSGAITESQISLLLEQIENKLIELNEEIKLRKKIYNILVEALQNLYHHLDNSEETYREFGEHFAVFVFSGKKGNYRLKTGNFVTSNKINTLKDRIDHINTLNRDQLRVLYKLILSNQEYTEKGGGGLGMIHIARRTGNKLDYTFIPYKNNYNFFCMEAQISEHQIE